MQAVLFRMTLPREPRLTVALRDIAERLAQCAGYPASEAVRIASSVGQAVDAVIGQLSADVPDQQIDVRFERGEDDLHVWMRYRAGAQARGPAAVDAALSREVLRQGMDSVEFGNENGMAYCHLRRQLPREKVDHQCEVPPPDAR